MRAKIFFSLIIILAIIKGKKAYFKKILYENIGQIRPYNLEKNEKSAFSHPKTVPETENFRISNNISLK